MTGELRCEQIETQWSSSLGLEVTMDSNVNPVGADHAPCSQQVSVTAPLLL